MSSAQVIHPVEMLVLQPTRFCNVDCSYCYLGGRQEKGQMSLQLVERIGVEVLQGGWTASSVTVVWHAGEPTVVDPSWFSEAFDILDRLTPQGVSLTHSFQTNGTLLDGRWIDLIRRRSVQIGISIDGPKWLHDRHRKTRRGWGTFDRAIRGLRLLREAGIPFHTISVLTDHSLDYPNELFDFFVSEEIGRVCLNIEELEGINTRTSLSANGTVERFAEFLGTFLDRLEQSPNPFWLRELASSLKLIRSSECTRNQQIEPFSILTIDLLGNVYTFSPEFCGISSDAYDNFKLGNILSNNLGAIAAAPAFSKLSLDVARGTDLCRDMCPWYAWCGGGAPANKFFENGRLDSTETLYCRLTKQIVLATVIDRVASGRSL